MARLFYHVMQDNLGNLLFDVVGTMRIAGTGTLAGIYGDEALTVPIGNPMTNHPSFGSFKCYLGPGTYDFYMAKAGYTFETLTGLQGTGTMAIQNANNVVITGGSAQNLNTLSVNTLTVPSFSQAYLNGPVGVLCPPSAGVALDVRQNKVDQFGLRFLTIGADTGQQTIVFFNLANTLVGSIVTSATATAYNTTSDGRLKEAVEALPDALATVLALRPVGFRWKADGSAGHGLVAQEVQQVLPEVVSGTETLGIDYSKLVPYLIGAVKELTQQVEMLTAKLASA